MTNEPSVIGDDVLSPVTEEQKNTLLIAVQKLYEETATSKWYHVWSENENDRQDRPIVVERPQIPTPEDWFVEETGKRDFLYGWTNYSHVVFEMAKEVVTEAYGRRFGDDWQEDGRLDNAACDAESKLSEWVESKLKDVSGQYSLVD
ncbi:Hypothetical protein PBC10988_25760 [Planctomycetales bacterium 10988]|nr:Hypothetical protein PBC10988_25760 [Planctomycetales bacterium 10988]